METYLKQKARHEKLINNFEMFFAFDEKQFKEGLKKLNVTKEEIISTYGGGFIRKIDKQKYINLFKSMDDDLKDSMKNKKFFCSALRYEMANHEYSYTYDITPTLHALGLDYDELTKTQITLFEKVKEKYLNSQIW